MGYARFVTRGERVKRTGEYRYHVRLWDDKGKKIYDGSADGVKQLVRVLDRTNDMVVDGLMAEAKKEEK